MLDLLLSLPGMRDHWGLWLAGLYLALGFRIGMREALATRRELARQDIADSLWPTLGLLTVFWPMIFAQRGVEFLILAWIMFGTAREEEREARHG